MALPKLETPKHSCTLPGNGQTVTYRPFLVGEQKLLLIAQESENQNDMLREMMRLIEICTDDVKVRELTSIDIEWLFLNIRMKSIGETSNVVVKCSEKSCEADNEIVLDLENDVVITEPEEVVSPVIQLTPTISIEFRHPSYAMMEEFNISEEEQASTNDMFKIISRSVVSIINDDEVLSRDDFTDKELSNFIDSMSSLMFNKIQQFFQSVKTLKIIKDFECKVCGKSNQIELEGIGNFFE